MNPPSRTSLLAAAFLAAATLGAAEKGNLGAKEAFKVDRAGATLSVGPTQALFMGPYMRWEDWKPSVMWVDVPQPTAYGTPEGWKGLTVGFSDQWGRPQATIRVPKGTDLYGSGEVYGDLRRNGTTVGLWATDNFGYRTYENRRLYQCHPWVLGVRPDGSAFGVIADSTYRGNLELGEDTIRFDFEGHTFPVLVMEGKDPQDVLRQLADRTGKMPLPPLWALGYQQSRWGYKRADECLGIAKRMREGRIPCDVMWMDIDYMRGHRVFTFDPKGFPDPKAYMAELHKLGMKGVWMIDPGIKHDPNAGYAAFDEGERLGAWVKLTDGKTDYLGKVWPGDCKFPDFTRREVRDWWADLNVRLVAQSDLDGLWNDQNEPGIFQCFGHTMPGDNVHGGDKPGDLPKGPHVKYHNIYGMLMIRATRDGLLKARPERRPFVLTRANFLGGHRYGYTWTGDNLSNEAHMRMSIPMSLNLSLSGQMFSGPDLGGFGGNATPELLRRWAGFGAFFPFCRNHTCAGTHAQEPWAFGKETEDAFRTAMERRYALIPYLYGCMREASRSGAAVMAPLFFTDPKDPALRREQQAFLLGADLLVLPAFAKGVALPKGDWRVATVLEDAAAEAQPDQATLLVRPGAAIPVVKPAQHTGALSVAELTLVANPGPDGTATGLLYEDAGDGFGHEKGDYCLTRFTVTVRDGKPKVRAETVEGKRPTAVRTVTVRLAKAR